MLDKKLRIRSLDIPICGQAGRIARDFGSLSAESYQRVLRGTPVAYHILGEDGARTKGSLKKKYEMVGERGVDLGDDGVDS